MYKKQENKYINMMGGVNPVAKREAFNSAHNGEIGYIKWILDNNYNVNEEELTSRATLLHYAAHHGHDNIVKLLIKHKANVNAKDVRGYTPLYTASVNGHTSTASLLIDHGAHIHEDPPKTNPLYGSTIQGHQATSLMLVERGAWPLMLLQRL